MGIFSSTKNPANALRFIRYMNGLEIRPITTEELDVLAGKDKKEEEK